MSKELLQLLIQVIKSWQVWVATGIIVVYIFIVSRVANLRHRPRQSFKRAKPARAEAAPEPSPQEEDGGDDELGLEEE